MLTLYNKLSAKSKNPLLTVNGKYGHIMFNAIAVEIFKLFPGKKINFGYDNTTGEWYFINQCALDYYFVLKTLNNKGYKGLYFNCIGLAGNIIEYYNQEHNLTHEGLNKTIRFRMATNEASFEAPDGTLVKTPDTYALLGGEELYRRNK